MYIIHSKLIICERRMTETYNYSDYSHSLLSWTIIICHWFNSLECKLKQLSKHIYHHVINKPLFVRILKKRWKYCKQQIFLKHILWCSGGIACEVLLTLWIIVYILQIFFPSKTLSYCTCHCAEWIFYLPCTFTYQSFETCALEMWK